MPKTNQKKTYRIDTEASLKEAVDILRAASPDLGIVIVTGNKLCPVDIPDFTSFSSRIQGREHKSIPLEERERRYFEFLERVRLVTTNYFPAGYGYVCLMRLVHRDIVRAIITTNYDQYLSAVLWRHGRGNMYIHNPCRSKTDRKLGEWDKDGYYSASELPKNGTPVWTIHGSLAFVRMHCGHVFALPKFFVQRANLSKDTQLISCHSAVLKKKGWYRDPTLAREHPSSAYQHHIDYGTDRGLFETESGVAKQLLLSHSERGGAVFVVGLSFSPRFKEDLTPTLLETAKKSPLVYIISSKKEPLTPNDSELYYELERQKTSFTLVNEISDDGALHEALVQITTRAGETGIEKEYENWKNSGRWWIS